MSSIVMIETKSLRHTLRASIHRDVSYAESRVDADSQRIAEADTAASIRVATALLRAFQSREVTALLP